MTVEFVTPGTRSLPANAWNEVAATVNRANAANMIMTSPKGGFDTQNITLYIKAHKELKIFDVISLADIETQKDDSAMLAGNFCFLSEDPDTEKKKQLLIMQEPCEEGKIARALAIGITPVKVTFKAKDTRFCALNGKKLEGSESGIPVLWQEGDSEEKWAIVCLGAGAGGRTVAQCKIKESTSDKSIWKGSVYVLGDYPTDYDKDILKDQFIYFDVQWNAVDYPKFRACAPAQIYDREERKYVAGWHVIDMSETIR